MPYLQISSENFSHNHKILKQILTKLNTQIAIVLKDNAYGHGLVQIASLANAEGIKTAFVKNANEALIISKYFEKITILYPDSMPRGAEFAKCLEISSKSKIDSIESKNLIESSTIESADSIESENLIESKNLIESEISPKFSKNCEIYFCAASLDFLHTMPSGAAIELKINSGMNRNGIAFSDLSAAFEIIKKRKLRLAGALSHNAYGDDFGENFKAQCYEWENIKCEVARLCESFEMPLPRFSSLSSSGAIRSALNAANTSKNNEISENTNFAPNSKIPDSLVRIGIAFYGYLCAEERLVSDFSAKENLAKTDSIAQEEQGWTCLETPQNSAAWACFKSNLPQMPLNLAPIASLWANRISTQMLQKGAKVGYSGAGQILDSEQNAAEGSCEASIESKDQKIAISTYDIGYGDGLFRLNENHEMHTAEGYAILGRVSMDCISVQASADKICVFADARQWAKIFNTIPYEILAHLAAHIPKIIV